MEYKDFSFEVKELSDEGTFTGYGAVFNNTDLDREIIEPGAFTRTLNEWRGKGSLPVMLAHHDMRQVIGTWETMREDDHGLFVKGELITEIQNARDMYTLMKKRAIRGLSIGYRAKDHEFDQDGVRHIKDLDLFEVSVVAIPANQSALLTGVKSLISRLDELSDDDRALLRKRLEADDETLALEEIKELEAADLERALRERRPSRNSAKFLTSLVQREVAQEKAARRDAEKADQSQREADQEQKQRAANAFAQRLASLHNQIRS